MKLNSISQIVTRLTSRRGRRQNKRSNYHGAEGLEQRLLLVAPGTVTGLNLTETSPPVGVTQNFAQVKFSWDSTATATNYDYWVSYGRNVPVVTGSTTDTSVDSNELSLTARANGQLLNGIATGFSYHVWVRASNSDGAGPWGIGSTFIVPSGIQPPPFEISALTKHDYRQSGSGWDVPVNFPNLTVQYVDYWIEKNDALLATGSYFTGALTEAYSNRELRSTFEDVFPQSEQDPGIYEIWVRARNGVGVSAWTGPFLRAIGQEQPQVTGPTSSSGSARPEITWSGGDPSVPFQIWIQRDGGPVVINERGISGTSYTPTEDLDPGLYRVWVRQVNESGAAMPWSSRYLVEVGTQTLPQRPVLNSDYLSNGAEPEIFWGADPLAVRWEVSITLRGNGQEVLRESTLTGTSWRSAEPLQVRVEYRIWLRAIGPTGVASRWSVPVDAIFENNLISYRTRN